MLKAIHAQESRDAADRKARAIVDDLRTARMNTVPAATAVLDWTFWVRSLAEER